ncbi:MAG: hypothetical protein LBG58_15365 [Planctomycetaceae bacterium]|jgi:hypothetical protein|nr:hypothetical protein [Planctomycetaceae bacterium]
MRIKLYLDTCIFGLLDKERERKTNEFFKFVLENQDKYELVISPITIDEINNAPNEIKTEIFDFIKVLNITKLPDLPEIVDFANDYVKEGILNKTQFEDLTHIAYASAFKCEILISWNRSHLAKDTTQRKLNEYNEKHKNFFRYNNDSRNLLKRRIKMEDREDVKDIYENENLKWIRDARNRTYEETKNMTLEEKKEYFRKKHENIYDVLNL